MKRKSKRRTAIDVLLNADPVFYAERQARIKEMTEKAGAKAEQYEADKEESSPTKNCRVCGKPFRHAGGRLRCSKCQSEKREV